MAYLEHILSISWSPPVYGSTGVGLLPQDPPVVPVGKSPGVDELEMRELKTEFLEICGKQLM